MNDEQPEPQPPVAPLEFTPEERAEFEMWERLSDEAFLHILQMEAQADAEREQAQQVKAQ